MKLVQDELYSKLGDYTTRAVPAVGDSSEPSKICFVKWKDNNDFIIPWATPEEVTYIHTYTHTLSYNLSPFHTISSLSLSFTLGQRPDTPSHTPTLTQFTPPNKLSPLPPSHTP